MLRIFADFNYSDEAGLVILNTDGALEDIEAQIGDVFDGAPVLLYVTDEFEVEGKLVFDGVWKGAPAWETVNYYPQP